MLTRLKINWKRRGGKIFVLLGLWFLASCSSETVDYGFGEYTVEIVTALGNDAFLRDTGQTLYDSNHTAIRTFASGDRVYLYFSEGNTPSDPIIVYGAAKIFSGELKAASESKIQSSANDPVRFESAWVGSHYLNLKFYMEYRSEAHKLALLVDETQVNGSEIHLYFRHDTNSDVPGYPMALYASFDLSSVLGAPEGNRLLFVHFNTTNYGNKTCALTY